MPDCRRLGHPCRAEHALLVAIDISQFRRCGVAGQKRGGLVPLSFYLGAGAGAGFVAAGDEDHVLLGRFCGGRVWGEEFFVVGHREGCYVEGSDFGGGGADGVFGCIFGRCRYIWYVVAGGEVGLCFLEPRLGLFAERLLSLGGSESREGESEGRCEVHDGDAEGDRVNCVEY